MATIFCTKNHIPTIQLKKFRYAEGMTVQTATPTVLSLARANNVYLNSSGLEYTVSQLVVTHSIKLFC